MKRFGTEIMFVSYSHQNEPFSETIFVMNCTFFAKAIKKDIFPNFNEKHAKIASFVSYFGLVLRLIYRGFYLQQGVGE